MDVDISHTINPKPDVIAKKIIKNIKKWNTFRINNGGGGQDDENK